jgi:hypothetical protein
MGLRLRHPRVVRKTANYTLSPDRDPDGTLFTNAGAAGTVVFTLPTPTKALLGVWYEFKGVVDQVITVAPPAVDTLVVFNDTAADSVSSGASGQRIGATMRATCIELTEGVYRWFVDFGSQGITYAIAT